MAKKVSYNFEILHSELLRQYNLEEFRTLCAAIGVNIDALPGEGLSGKIREVILVLDRTNRVHVLRRYVPQAFTKAGTRTGRQTIELVPSAAVNEESRDDGEASDRSRTSTWVAVAERLVLLIVALVLIAFAIWVYVQDVTPSGSAQYELLGLLGSAGIAFLAKSVGGTFGLDAESKEVFGTRISLSTAGGIGFFGLSFLLWQIPILLNLGSVEKPAPVPEKPVHAELIVDSLGRLQTKTAINSTAFNSSSNLVAASIEPRKIGVWQVDSGQAPTMLATSSPFPTSSIEAIAFHPNGEWVIGGDSEGILWKWTDLKDPRPKLTSSHTGKLFEVYLSHDGRRLVSTGRDKGESRVARLWQLDDSITKVDELRTDNLTDRILGVSPSLTDVVINKPQEKKVEIRSLITKRHIQSLDRSELSSDSGAAYTSDGKYIVIGDKNGRLKIWDSGSGKLVIDVGALNESISRVDVSQVGDTIIAAAGYVNGKVFIWYGPEYKQIELTEKLADNIYTLKFSPDSTILAAGGKDRQLQLWRLTFKTVSDIGFSWPAFSHQFDEIL